jgi:hypothetical protein
LGQQDDTCVLSAQLTKLETTLSMQELFEVA